MPDLDREELLGDDIDDPNRTRNCLIIATVTIILLALTLLMGFGHA
jgi:hypothetical protein